MNVMTMTSGQAIAKPMRGKVVLITGSTSGIGLGIAEAFAAAGASIVLNGLGRAEEIERLRAEMEDRYATPVIFSPADMSRHRSIEEIIVTTLARVVSLYILLNNIPL